MLQSVLLHAFIHDAVEGCTSNVIWPNMVWWLTAVHVNKNTVKYYYPGCQAENM